MYNLILTTAHRVIIFRNKKTLAYFIVMLGNCSNISLILNGRIESEYKIIFSDL